MEIHRNWYLKSKRSADCWKPTAGQFSLLVPDFRLLNADFSINSCTE